MFPVIHPNTKHFPFNTSVDQYFTVIYRRTPDGTISFCDPLDPSYLMAVPLDIGPFPPDPGPDWQELLHSMEGFPDNPEYEKNPAYDTDAACADPGAADSDYLLRDPNQSFCNVYRLRR
jgi:hypothetical protein